jgi:hypothetical protein
MPWSWATAEAVVVELARAWLAWKESGTCDRPALLKRWSELKGYHPRIFEARYDRSGFQSLVPRFADYATVKRAIVADLDARHFPTGWFLSENPCTTGCGWKCRGAAPGCRFCQAGMLYRPVRSAHRNGCLTWR